MISGSSNRKITKPDSSSPRHLSKSKSKKKVSETSITKPTSKTTSKSPRSQSKSQSKIIQEQISYFPIFKKYIVDINNYELIKKEEKSGAFGEVKFAREKSTGKIYAIKLSKYSLVGDPLKFVLREITILINAKHPAVVPIHGISFKDFDEGNNLLIFLDYMKNGSLYDVLDQERHSLSPEGFDNTKKQKILIGIAYGMMHLHHRHIIHRDLKSQNVLLDENFRPYITDFGLAKMFDKSNEIDQSMCGCGTPRYMAPEVFEDYEYGTKADVYSFGIMMYEIVTGKIPFEELGALKYEQLKRKVVNGVRPELDGTDIKEGMMRMIEQCWNANPDKRPTFAELFNKLSLGNDDFYFDSNNNPCEPVFNYKDDDDKYGFQLMNTKFCFDNVDFNELFLYIDDITSNNASNDSKEFRDEINSLKTHNKEIENKVKNLKNENKQLKNDVELLKKENVELKKMISNLKLGSNGQINENTNIEKPPEKKPISSEQQNIQKKLRKQCLELKKKVKNGELTAVELPEGLLRIPDDLFSNCSQLKEVKIPSSVEHIGKNAFFLSSITSIDIPSSVISIGEGAFRSTDLESIELPPFLKTISNMTFNYCRKLTNVKIPSSVLCIEGNAFEECLSLKFIEIPSSVTKIGSTCFAHCRSLLSIRIPQSVTSMGCHAFSTCTSLESINIPSSITEISTGVFTGCSSLESIVIPSSVVEISSHAFEGCTSLENIEIPSSVTHIGSNTFKGCISLVSISITSVTTIEKSAFSDCTSLKSVILSSSLKTISERTFYACSSLKNIKIPSSVTKIDEYAFQGCSSLEKIEIPSSLTDIHETAFPESIEIIRN